MTTNASEIAIINLIPQKPPFVMVDKIVCYDERSTTTQFTIKEDNIFIENGLFREPGLIENIAQTLAAQGGISYANQNGEAPVGMIGAIKNLLIYSLPPVNSTILTRVTVEMEVLGATLIKGDIRLDDTLIAECEMKIFIKKED